ncbi:uncharacterized protein TNIN_364271 [Trichonephila inaurata madagascariensis]|uniref:Uncharacterized protein n=1 Tax=Trichonephila inaurata madagascariensis TaxID=2747483 RepID=A0A8X6I907_9ARAC|nr:uncharacterized protein TNIN_364271 [Trichonephila inaurata madagascariensis]
MFTTHLIRMSHWHSVNKALTLVSDKFLIHLNKLVTNNAIYSVSRVLKKSGVRRLRGVALLRFRITCQVFRRHVSSAGIRSRLNRSSPLHQDHAKISKTLGVLPLEPGKDMLNMCLSDPVDRYTALFIFGKCRL